MRLAPSVCFDPDDLFSQSLKIIIIILCHTARKEPVLNVCNPSSDLRLYSHPGLGSVQQGRIMEITQAGKERASSAEFYQYLKTTVAKLKAQKLHDGMLAVLISNIIG